MKLPGKGFELRPKGIWIRKRRHDDSFVYEAEMYKMNCQNQVEA